MAIVTNLLILYAGLVLINTLLSAALWLRSREPLHRALVLVWGSTLLSYVMQGALVQSSLVITLAFVSVFLVNGTLAALVARVLDMRLGWLPYIAIVAAAVVVSVVAAVLGKAFVVVALPVAIAVSLPCLVIAVRAVRSGKSLSIVTRGLIVSCVLFSLHNIDFAFLRDKPDMAPLGFTVATLIIFALSITAPAAVLERVTERQARVDAEVEAARAIQTKLMPVDVRLPGYEVVTHMRPAESVGGDYFDVYSSPDGSWFFLGDVTGHGLGAGLVTLMAQSTISSILSVRPDIRPAELNHRANAILTANLARLGEQRHITFVALRCVGPESFVVSGSHDTAFVYRAGTSTVEAVPLEHFPFGLGFISDLDAAAFREDTLALGPGDVLFVGSDGIAEAARGGDATRGMFGEDAVASLLREQAAGSLAELKRSLVDRLDQFTGGVYHDDVSFVMVRVEPVPVS